MLDTVAIDSVAPSPDGSSLAVVIQRPARRGEVFGRNAYETDPSRSDVWLVSRTTNERRNLTRGAAVAAGFWCAAWSPDGSRLAMLSTKAEGTEPRGGNNVRLYVWDRKSGSLRRVAADPLVTQTRYGSGLDRLDVRGGADAGTVAHHCGGDENAPFAWLDNRRLLALILPAGAVSGLLDEYSRPLRHTAATATALRDGVEPTLTASGSGDARPPGAERTETATLQIFDAQGGRGLKIADVPLHPFLGELTVSIAPDRSRAAILATTGAIPPLRGLRFPTDDYDSWTVEKRLGFVALAPGAAVRWLTLPAAARYPLDLYGWSPDGLRVALRARAAADQRATPLFVANADTGTIGAAAPATLSVGNIAAGTPAGDERPVFWADADHLLVRGEHRDLAQGTAAGGRLDWWLVGQNADAANLTAAMTSPPAQVRRGAGGRLVALDGANLVALDAASAAFRPIGKVEEGARIVWPEDPDREAGQIVIASGAGSDWARLRSVRLDTAESTAPIPIPTRGRLFAAGPQSGALLWGDPTREGLFLRESAFGGDGARTLLSLDLHLADIDWGKTMLVDYRGANGEALKAAVILPPDYLPGRLYPTITWVYGGYRVRSLDDYFLDPYLPGLYNLQLYAARGYVILIPSMPIDRSALPGDPYLELPKGVLPAVDRLVALGIADPNRVGVMGQSFGGYSVYGLLSQTSRFKAGVALAGITDLVTDYGAFDRTARGYPGIEQEKSDNWGLMKLFGLNGSPLDDQARAWRNSPLAYVDKVDTPLLLVHGEYDKRGSLVEAEAFFYALYRQGKTARLLRYWGESHSLAQSPANIRSIVAETLGWFDRYLAAPVAK